MIAGSNAAPAHRELVGQAEREIKAGNIDGARALYLQLLATDSRDAEALDAVGVLGLRLGDLGNAERLHRLAVSREPQVARYRCNLAVVLRHLGKMPEAITELDRAATLAPGDVQVHIHRGNGFMDCGRFGEAAAAFERALAVGPGHADALYGLGTALQAMEQYDRACASLAKAVLIEPAFHEAHAGLAAARMSRAAELERESPPAAGLVAGQAIQAMESISMALRVCPDNPLYWVQFAECIKTFELRHPISESARDLLSRALDHPLVHPDSLVHVVVGLVNSHPDALALKRLLPPSGVLDGLAWSEAGPLVSSVLADSLLLKLMRDAVVPDAFVERVVNFARRAMLAESLAMPAPSLPAVVVAALAHYGFNTEYAGDERDDDAAAIDALIDRIRQQRAAGNAVPPHWYAAYAAYRPLYALEGAEQIEYELDGTPFLALALRQITEPRVEHSLRSGIAAITALSGEVSVAVQAQYETNPYPRWIRPRRLWHTGTVRSVLQSLFPHTDMSGALQAPPRVLIAGCGTGQHPIMTAQRFGGASVLAVDLSLTSLAYAKRKTQELGITGIEYRQGDILELGSLGERFDVIESSGVLHHLEDPLAGWRVLRGLLRPGGVMNIGLYSEIGRKDVIRAREYIEAQGYEATADGIRRCRAAILSNQAGASLENLLHSDDFYSMSGCRDLIFHVQEHRFTLPQIQSCLDTLGLRFIGFELPEPAIGASYRTVFPGDVPMQRLDHWHQYETAHPDTFGAMYQFWVGLRQSA